jgi:hypothetical protein
MSSGKALFFREAFIGDWPQSPSEQTQRLLSNSIRHFQNGYSRVEGLRLWGYYSIIQTSLQRRLTTKDADTLFGDTWRTPPTLISPDNLNGIKWVPGCRF